MLMGSGATGESTISEGCNEILTLEPGNDPPELGSANRDPESLSPIGMGIPYGSPLKYHNRL